MLSKNTLSYLKSLREKEWRKHAWAFLVEWEKNILEFFASDFTFLEGYFTQSFLDRYEYLNDAWKITVCSEWDIERISSLSSNSVWVAVFQMRKNTLPKEQLWITLILDGINDPGNLGTIIRTADWYGIRTIIASPHTVDAYNPKVIMATMGSLSRMNIVYLDLVEYLSQVTLPVYGAYLEGENIHTIWEWPENMHLVIGSESHGISWDIEKHITTKITIPRFWRAESLNAWVATAIILDNFKRKRN